MSNAPTTRPSRNLLLAALEPDEVGILEPDLTHVELPLRTVLFHQDAHVTHVFFPLSGITSLVMTSAQGATVEMATVGREGVVGLPVMADKRGAATNQAISQIAGAALRMPIGLFTEHLGRLDHLAGLVGEFTGAFVALLGQNAACNRLHTTEQRLSRWLLMCRDRVETDQFPLTQEFIGQMLGVRQGSVSDAAQALQDVEVIRYQRGTINILDPARLEACACECYPRIRSRYEVLYH